MGHTKTSVCILHNGVLEAVRIITFGGLHITEMLQKTYHVSLEEAESVKIEKGYLICEKEDTFNEDQRVFSNTLKSALQPLIRDLNQTFTSFMATHKKNVKRIYLTGGSTLLRNLDRFLTQELQIETEALSALSTLKYSHISDSPEVQAKVLPTLALGLQYISHLIPLNLRRGSFAKGQIGAEISRLLKPVLKVAAAIVLILGVNFLGRLFLGLHHKNAIDDKISMILKKHHTDLKNETISDATKLERYLTTKKQELETKLSILKTSSDAQVTPLHVMTEISNVIATHPREKMMIQKLQFSENIIKVEGLSDTENGAVILRSGLQFTPYLQVTASETLPLEGQKQRQKFTIELKVRAI